MQRARWHRTPVAAVLEAACEWLAGSPAPMDAGRWRRAPPPPSRAVKGAAPAGGGVNKEGRGDRCSAASALGFPHGFRPGRVIWGGVLY